MKQTINYAHMAGGLEAAYRSILKHDSLRHLSKEAVEEILLTIDADIKGIEERAKAHADRLKGEVAAISGAGDFFSEFEGVSNLRDNEDARHALDVRFDNPIQQVNEWSSEFNG
tara:strand:+ start:198 stop:539 length:342 start_codon:yes stop_codon:yes gene_type:complete